MQIQKVLMQKRKVEMQKICDANKKEKPQENGIVQATHFANGQVGCCVKEEGGKQRTITEKQKSETFLYDCYKCWYTIVFFSESYCYSLAV